MVKANNELSNKADYQVNVDSLKVSNCAQESSLQ